MSKTIKEKYMKLVLLSLCPEVQEWLELLTDIVNYCDADAIDINLISEPIDGVIA